MVVDIVNGFIHFLFVLMLFLAEIWLRKSKLNAPSTVLDCRWYYSYTVCKSYLKPLSQCGNFQ